jgi:hypothetical protein
MSYLLTLVSRYSYAKIAARFNVTQTYIRAVTGGVRMPSNRLITLSRNLYRTTMYNRMRVVGINVAQARAWRSNRLAFIDGVVGRYKSISKQIAAQRDTTQAAIMRSLSQSTFAIEELEERYTTTS